MTEERKLEYNTSDPDRRYRPGDAPKWPKDLPVDSDAMIGINGFYNRVVDLTRRTRAAVETYAEDVTLPAEGRRELIRRKLAESKGELIDLETRYVAAAKADRDKLESALLNGRGLDTQPLRMHEIRRELREIKEPERIALVLDAIKNGDDNELLAAVVSAPKVARLVPPQIHERAARAVAPDNTRNLRNLEDALTIADAALRSSRALLSTEHDAHVYEPPRKIA